MYFCPSGKSPDRRAGLVEFMIKLIMRWWAMDSRDLGSGLIDQSQKMTVAAMQMADMKVWAHRS